MLDRVTITGADDRVKVNDLIRLNEEFPFVEWGILLSQSQHGNPRYPSYGWLEELAFRSKNIDIKLSAHLCGSWVRELMAGNHDPKIPDFIQRCQRTQLNTFNSEVTLDRDVFLNRCERLLPNIEQFICQWGINNNKVYHTLEFAGFPAVPLFDYSGGNGVVPRSWQAADPAKFDYVGYAGGLNPSNIVHHLAFITEAAGDLDFWIDCETGVRNDNNQMDIDKVVEYLQFVKPFVAPQN